MAIFFVVGLVFGGFGGGGGGVLAYGLEQMNGMDEKSGWRWIFIWQGVLTIIIALLGYLFTVDFPEAAHRNTFRFLTPSDLEIVIDRVRRDQDDVKLNPFELTAYLRHALDWRLWLFAANFFTSSQITYSVQYFLPIILQTSLGFSTTYALCLTTPVNDKKPERQAYRYAHQCSAYSFIGQELTKPSYKRDIVQKLLTAVQGVTGEDFVHSPRDKDKNKGQKRERAIKETGCPEMTSMQGQPCIPQYTDPSLLHNHRPSLRLTNRSLHGITKTEKPTKTKPVTGKFQAVPRERPARSEVDPHYVVESFRLTPDERTFLLDLLHSANPSDLSPRERDPQEEEFWADYVHLLDQVHALGE
ncbi:hypothetical protein BO86DRAFT_383902 [Aspergillus japonicus CBS 114.51]|uniref:MFS general substrate transporter n=1 Tax=Aspergillus japonicus CBS 114.51 TaxID=1448312 RepID=A0A8T8WKV6_ASPJA|nr:hypothetical protein BO86DRAFT_383902 [Aspergillus japonicus CBS 114.51]RAH76353.1 hypothetical protein BO86DRAFT_383902 [Aspergillus japonicus CBS 114.51]